MPVSSEFLPLKSGVVFLKKESFYIVIHRTHRDIFLVERDYAVLWTYFTVFRAVLFNTCNKYIYFYIFQGGFKIYLELSQISKMELFAEVLKYFCKKIHLRRLTGFWTRLIFHSLPQYVPFLESYFNCLLVIELLICFEELFLI